MTETREIKDPFTGKTATISNDLVRRLRGEYANGPTLENGEPEFGWVRHGVPTPIMLEAAKEIERLRECIRKNP